MKHKFTLQRVRLNSQGYDSTGAYWGIDQPLYWFCSNDCLATGYIRAQSRHDAKEKIRALFPNAKFYR